MASELVTFDQAAKLLKVSAQQLQDMVARRELSPLRGTSPPKFKMEDLERVADDLGISLGSLDDEHATVDPSVDFESSEEAELEEETGGAPSSSILVTERELGASQGPSSTVIGDDEGSGPHDSDLVLASSSDAAQAGEGSSLRLATTPGDSGELQLAPDSSVSAAPAPQAQAYAEESDLKLAPVEVKPAGAGSDLEPTDSDLEKMGGSDLELTGDSDLDLGAEVMPGAGESDLLLAGASDIGPGDTGRLDVKPKTSDLEFATDDLDIEVTDSGSALDLGDEELVLDSESALDGDIALAGDSGINLAKPSDSGIDLAAADESGISVAPTGDSGFMLEDEDALKLEGGSSGDSLELPEDVDVVSLDEDLADPDAATQLKSHEDFDLTPVEGAIEDESDSGSQVIALDTEGLDAEAPTQLGGVGVLEMQPMDEAVITEEPSAGAFPGVVVQPGMETVPQQQVQYPTQELPELPYTGWQVGSLAIVALMLAFGGILMIDVVRNIWSFDQPYAASTSIMNSIVEALGI